MKVLLVLVLCATLCGAVLDKLMVGSCCNDDPTYPYQETWAQQKYSVVGLFGGFCKNSFYSWSFGVVRQQWNASRVTHYTLSPQDSNGCLDTGRTLPSDPNNYILSGGFDDYIGFFVDNLKSFLAGPDGTLGNADDRRMYLRLSHELNGNWYSWSSNSTSYAMMWRYVWNKVMVGTGITKTHVQWIFEPVSPYEPSPAHDFRLYWPGDQFVDWLSLDAYNEKQQQNWYHPWEIFDNMLYKLREWRPALPVAVSETGAATINADWVPAKTQWLRDLFPYLAGWNVQMLVYFNVYWNNGREYMHYPFFNKQITGDETYTVGNTTYNAYEGWKDTIQDYGYKFAAGNPRLMTDDEFLGRLPGYTTPPAQPRNLIIYTDGANYYDWRCTEAGAGIKIGLRNTTQHLPDETYSMYAYFAAWGNVQLHSSHDGANTSFYRGIQFSIWATKGDIEVSVIPFMARNLNATKFRITAAKTWQQVTYTWAELKVPIGMLKGFYLFNPSNNDQEIHVSQAQLLSGPVNWVLGTTSGTTQSGTSSSGTSKAATSSSSGDSGSSSSTAQPTTNAPTTANPVGSASTINNSLYLVIFIAAVFNIFF